MFDIHCHIAYGSDDGAESPDVALKMMTLASECGTDGIVVTPHSNVPESYRNYVSDNILDKLKQLKKMASEKGLELKLFSGQEIFMTAGVPSLLEKGELITINNSKYPLVEFDFFEHEKSVYRKLEKLVSLGFVPVVAHPERYAFVIRDEEAAIQLRNIGCVLQINKGSIEGRFGEEPFRAAHSMLSQQLADIVASDAHSPYMRTPDMRKAHEIVSAEYSFEYAELLFSRNPVKVLQNKEIIRY